MPFAMQLKQFQFALTSNVFQGMRLLTFYHLIFIYSALQPDLLNKFKESHQAGSKRFILRFPSLWHRELCNEISNFS